MSNAFVRVPPDSTGKRILHSDMIILDVENVTISLDDIVFGSTITGGTSGATGKFVGYDIRLGVLSVHVSNESAAWTVGESLIYNGSPFADITTSTTVYVPQVGIIDTDTHNPVKVDDKGALFTRQAEGSQLFDAFGNSQMTTNRIIDEHTFLYGTNAQRYYDVTGSGGTITADVTKSLMKLNVTDVSGSIAQRTSNIYYPYSPGEGTYTIFSLGPGDVGKAGVVRRWGLYDNDNGVYFQLSGSVFSVNEKSSVSGAPVVTSIVQSDFNGDRLLDANVDAFVIDFSKINLYWIDFQWLGAGRIRFGTIAPDGSRVTLHTVENANSNTGPYMQSGTLPVRWEMFNETATASSSEFKVICVSVIRQSFQTQFNGTYYTNSSYQIPVSGSGYFHLMSARPKLTLGGKTNRRIALPQSVQVNVDGDPVEVSLLVNSTLSGASFTGSSSPFSAFDVEAGAGVTLSTTGSALNRNFYSSGVTNRELDMSLLNGLRLSSDGVTQPIFTLAARCPKPSGTATVDVIVRWQEVQ